MAGAAVTNSLPAGGSLVDGAVMVAEILAVGSTVAATAMASSVASEAGVKVGGGGGGVSVGMVGKVGAGAAKVGAAA